MNSFSPRVFALTAACLLLGASISSAQAVVVKEEKAGMLKLAKVSPEAASATALARVPGGKIRSGEIEKEDGKLIYTFIVKVAGKSGVEEVNVDALTGKIVVVEHEADPEEAKAATPKAKGKTPPVTPATKSPR